MARNETTEEAHIRAKRAVSAAGLTAKNWMLVEQTEFYLKIIHKSSGTERTIDRYAIPGKGVKVW